MKHKQKKPTFKFYYSVPFAVAVWSHCRRDGRSVYSTRRKTATKTHAKVLTYEDGKRSYTERETVLNRCDARLCKNDYTELNTQIRITTDNGDTTMQHEVNGRVEIR